MKAYIFLSFSIFYISVGVSVGKELPAFIKKCKKDVSIDELEKCLIDRAAVVLPKLVEGSIKELKLPSINPMIIPEIDVAADNNLHTNFKNVKIFGIANLEIQKLKMDFANKKMETRVVIPFMTVESIYKLTGKILLFELNSSGKSTMNITNTVTAGTKEFEIKTKNGKNYIILGKKTMNMDVKFKNGGIYFENVIPGNEQLSEEVNKVINDNFEEITKDISPLIVQTISEIIDSQLGGVLGEFSIEELFD